MQDSLGATLAANGLYSAVSGAILAFGSAALDSTVGLDAWFLALAGVSLVGYGVFIAWLGRRKDPTPGATFATAMDVAWIVGAAVILLGFPSVMTTTGRVALLIVSIPVTAFAVAQGRMLKARADG